MTYSRKIEVGDILKASFQSKDLVNALRNIKPVQAENFRTNNKKEIQANSLNHKEVASDLIYYQKQNSQTKGSVSKGAFPMFGVYAQQDEDKIAESQPQPESPKPSKKGKKKDKAKRKRAETTGPPTSNSNGKSCRVCFGPYNLSEYYYTIDGKALETQRPNQSLRRFVDERID